MKAIIVDDEPMAIDLLKGYLKHFQSIELVGSFRNALKAFEFMNAEHVDLVFLDINMPHLSGLSFSKMIDPATKIIFTTAYSEYAAESYEVEAVDYLLKPISLARFTKAISKILQSHPSTNHSPVSNIIIVRSGTKQYHVRTADINHLEKEGNYMTYHMTDQKVVARLSVSEALSELPGNFVQIHKSYIININRIDFINKQEVSVAGQLLPIGDLYKDEFTKRLKEWI